jgi:hypothetical protein
MMVQIVVFYFDDLRDENGDDGKGPLYHAYNDE